MVSLVTSIAFPCNFITFSTMNGADGVSLGFYQFFNALQYYGITVKFQLTPLYPYSEDGAYYVPLFFINRYYIPII
jgi:hypothetical protein